jgi:hypothetical protein
MSAARVRSRMTSLEFFFWRWFLSVLRSQPNLLVQYMQFALGDSDRKRASTVLWPNEEPHRCCSSEGSLKPTSKYSSFSNRFTTLQHQLYR